MKVSHSKPYHAVPDHFAHQLSAISAHLLAPAYPHTSRPLPCVHSTGTRAILHYHKVLYGFHDSPMVSAHPLAPAFPHTSRSLPRVHSAELSGIVHFTKVFKGFLDNSKVSMIIVRSASWALWLPLESPEGHLENIRFYNGF